MLALWIARLTPLFPSCSNLFRGVSSQAITTRTSAGVFPPFRWNSRRSPLDVPFAFHLLHFFPCLALLHFTCPDSAFCLRVRTTVPHSQTCLGDSPVLEIFPGNIIDAFVPKDAGSIADEHHTLKQEAHNYIRKRRWDVAR